MPKTVAFYTLGCKLNFAETSTLARTLLEQGFRKVDFTRQADLYVINTCSVTEQANRKCRQVIHRALRQNPAARVVVTGCYAQLKPEELASIPGVDLVLGANEKFHLKDYLNRLDSEPDSRIHACEIESFTGFYPSYSIGDRTRSYLKIQDGCDYPCTYCTIPMARGRSRSTTIDRVLQQAGELAAAGIREIVLTGINTGDFGKHPGNQEQDEESFLELIRALDREAAVDRFRISSIEPNLLTDEIIDFVASSSRFMPHFHIPLQSGSGKILRLMRRRYNTALYRSRVERVKKLMPHACIGVDVITGFPGEGEKEFRESLSFLKSLDVSYLHVFTWSERPGTPAASMPGKVPEKIRHERTQMLRLLGEQKRKYFYRQFEGTQRKALFEAPKTDGLVRGFTDNYIKVKVSPTGNLTNQLLRVTLHRVEPDGEMLAELSDQMVEC